MTEFGTMIARDTVRIERTLPGPIERVWAYLTESDRRATWLAAGDMELRRGGKVEHIFRNNSLTPNDDPPPAKYASSEDYYRMEGRITVFEPPHRLGYTWGEERGDDSEVLFELTPSGSNVRLVVTHMRLATRDDIVSVGAGWHTHLGVLAARLAGEEPEGFWRSHIRLEAEYERRIPADEKARA
jgi:uncharacterized protein YndB with AHSA1/START domain